MFIASKCPERIGRRFRTMFRTFRGQGAESKSCFLFITNHSPIDRLNYEMLQRTIIGVKGAEHNVRFFEEVVRRAFRPRSDASAVPLFVMDDNIVSLKLKMINTRLRDEHELGKRTSVAMSTAFAKARELQLPIFSCSRYANPMHGKAAAADRVGGCIVSRWW